MLNEEEAALLKSKIEDHEKRISSLETMLPSKIEVFESVRKEFSIKEFILSIGLASDVQKTLGIGYFLERHRGLNHFNVKDLENGFREAKERVPKNINLCVTKNVQKGRIMEDRERKDNLKAWILTNSGEKFVEDNMKSENS